MAGIFSFNILEGSWRLNRHGSGGVAMEGIAAFSVIAPGRLSYKEEGRHVGSDLEFTRSYDYAAQGADLLIFYADGPDAGKLFLTFEGVIGKAFPFGARADHLCLQDHYAAEMTFKSVDEFSMRYDVNGPSKNYTITTHYSKL